VISHQIIQLSGKIEIDSVDEVMQSIERNNIDQSESQKETEIGPIENWLR
jgi:hypothetical protein